MGVSGCKHWGYGRGNVGLSIEECEREQSSHRWRRRVIVMLHAAPEVAIAWYSAIWSIIKGMFSLVYFKNSFIITID